MACLSEKPVAIIIADHLYGISDGGITDRKWRYRSADGCDKAAIQRYCRSTDVYDQHGHFFYCDFGAVRYDIQISSRCKDQMASCKIGCSIHGSVIYDRALPDRVIYNQDCH